MKLRNKNTGEIGILNLKVYGNDADYVYDTFETLYEEWEDYTPAEPLIKDEKVRKAVKTWAEANDYDSVLYDKDEDCVYSAYGSDKTDTSVSISFDLDGMFKGLGHRCSYTITELCGEEEE